VICEDTTDTEASNSAQWFFPQARTNMPKTLRAAVIGATGKGGYGHGLDTTFLGIKGVELVAIADENPNGLKRAGQKLKIDKLYADYRNMLDREKPDIVSIGPRWVTERVKMIETAAAAGCHIHCEKPMAGTLHDADAIVAACDQAGVKISIAHQWRAMPPVHQAIKQLKEGRYGKLLRMRARPKDDARGGGEELIVHGTHLFDLMMAFAGKPRWVSAHVAVGNRDATKNDRREGTEPVGPIAGNSIAAVFGFDNGIRGYFDTTANLSKRGESRFDNLYGLFLECERAALHLRSPGDVYIYPAPLNLPDLDNLKWEKMWIEDWHFTAEHKPRPLRKLWLHLGNTFLANNLVEAIRNNREPISSGRDVRYVIEMVQGVYASHFAKGQRLSIPLADRSHPLETD